MSSVEGERHGHTVFFSPHSFLDPFETRHRLNPPFLITMPNFVTSLFSEAPAPREPAIIEPRSVKRCIWSGEQEYSLCGR